MIHVETMTAGFNLRAWPAGSVAEAEKLAHDLSVTAADNPTLPNPFLVVDGTVIAKYDCGLRTPAQ